MRHRLKAVTALLFAMALLVPAAGESARLASAAPSCCAGACPMEKKEGPVQAACCKGSVPAESRLAAPLPQTLAALPAPEPMLAPARTASGVFHFQRRMPDSHAPPYPTGPSPPALA